MLPMTPHLPLRPSTSRLSRASHARSALLCVALSLTLTGCIFNDLFPGDCGRMSAASGAYETGEEKEWCGSDYDTFGFIITDEQVVQLFPDSLDVLENDMASLLIPTPVIAWWATEMHNGAVFSYPETIAGLAVIYDPDYQYLVGVNLVAADVEILSEPRETDYGQVYRVRWSVSYEDSGHWVESTGEDDVQFSVTTSTSGGSVVVYPPGQP